MLKCPVIKYKKEVNKYNEIVADLHVAQKNVQEGIENEKIYQEEIDKLTKLKNIAEISMGQLQKQRDARKEQLINLERENQGINIESSTRSRKTFRYEIEEILSKLIPQVEFV